MPADRNPLSRATPAGKDARGPCSRGGVRTAPLSRGSGGGAGGGGLEDIHHRDPAPLPAGMGAIRGLSGHGRRDGS